ncbi:MAG: acetolactate synthase [Tannerella sp.]|nr:acetolactate synthase [Tannerella sp.]
MTVNQISVFIENKYGKLCEILTFLASEQIRIIAATVADTSEYGILRLIVSDPQRAFLLLKENGVSANLTEVLAIVSQSSAEGFARTLCCFTRSGLSIEYMYGFSLNGKSILILRTSDREAAHEVIRRQQLEYLTENDLMNF